MMYKLVHGKVKTDKEDIIMRDDGKMRTQIEVEEKQRSKRCEKVQLSKQKFRDIE